MKNSENLTNKERIFCQEYTFDWNGTRAYRVAFPTCKSDMACGANANRLLKKDKVQNYISEIQRDIEKQTNSSKKRLIAELEKIAYNNISSFHNTWIERKDFNNISEDDKAAIQEISTKVVKTNVGTSEAPMIVDVEYVKLKLYDKNKAIETLNRMLGYNVPEKVDVTSKGEKIAHTKEELMAELELIRSKREEKV